VIRLRKPHRSGNSESRAVAGGVDVFRAIVFYVMYEYCMPAHEHRRRVQVER
jgi:hypothetical protein